MSETTPRERRHERTRQEILNTAMAIIREKGADKLSLREVARRIDYSPSGLYEYFASKDALVEAICTESDSRLLRHMKAVPPGDDPTAYLANIGLAYLEFARQNPHHYFFLFGNREADISAFDIEAHRADYPDDPILIGLDAVDRAITAGAINPRGQDVLTITYQFWATLHGMAMLQLQYFKTFPVAFEEADRAGIETLIRGMRA